MQDTLETWVRSMGREDPPGEEPGNPLQYSCLKGPMDRGAWWGTVHGVKKSWTRLRRFATHVCIPILQIRKLRFREVRWLAQGSPVGRDRSRIEHQSVWLRSHSCLAYLNRGGLWVSFVGVGVPTSSSASFSFTGLAEAVDI